MARYVVVRYFPVSDNGECVNAGVIAYDDNCAMARFVADWGRVQRFGQTDVTFLREFAREVTRSVSPDACHSDRLDKERIEAMAARWGDAIQFSPPAGSLLCVSRLLEEMAGHFLPNRVSAVKPRTRSAARATVRDALRDAFLARGVRRPSDFVKQRFSIAGEVKSHEFDFAVANGQIRDGIFAFSFAGGVNNRLMTEIEAAAFAIEDVRSRIPNLHLSTLILEPESETDESKVARDIFLSKKVMLVTKENADIWAEEVTSRYIHA